MEAIHYTVTGDILPHTHTLERSLLFAPAFLPPHYHELPTPSRPQSARKLLERALQSLPARKHIKLLLRAALTEFRLGSAERGRGILEGVLRNYPKRLDLWNVYIDQELKVGGGIGGGDTALSWLSHLCLVGNSFEFGHGAGMVRMCHLFNTSLEV